MVTVVSRVSYECGQVAVSHEEYDPSIIRFEIDDQKMEFPVGHLEDAIEALSAALEGIAELIDETNKADLLMVRTMRGGTKSNKSDRLNVQYTSTPTEVED